MGGGQSRVFNIYANLASEYEVTILSISGSVTSIHTEEIADGVTEITIPFSEDYHKYDQSLSKTVDWFPVTDIATINGYSKIDGYTEILKRLSGESDIICLSHPFLINAVKDTRSDIGKEIWFEVHNTEFDLKEQTIPATSGKKELLDLVLSAEEDCWKAADVIFACTERDLIRLTEMYGERESSVLTAVVPNGVDDGKSKSLVASEKSSLKVNLGIEGRHTALFMGSWHGPNIEAAQIFIDLAKDFENIYFFIIGSVSGAIKDMVVPENVIVFGMLSDAEKTIVLSASDVAINPMILGSGSSLKILDYFAHSIPVISTEFGMRGIDAIDGESYIMSSILELNLKLNEFYGLSNSRFKDIGLMAKKLQQKKYSWNVIVIEFIKKIKGVRK
jgi:glycosyltransferase involved in cell wall biosynthesis